MNKRPNDQEPETEWECRRCGALNSHLMPECHWCQDEEPDWDAIRADHLIDQRKHER